MRLAAPLKASISGVTQASSLSIVDESSFVQLLKSEVFGGSPVILRKVAYKPIEEVVSPLVGKSLCDCSPAVF